MIDCLMLCVPRENVAFIQRVTIPVKDWPKIKISHFLFRHTLFQALGVFRYSQNWWLLSHDSFIFKSFIKHRNRLTCVQPDGYNLSFVCHTYMYVPSYTRDFVVHIVYKILCYLKARNERNKYI